MRPLFWGILSGLGFFALLIAAFVLLYTPKETALVISGQNGSKTEIFLAQPSSLECRQGLAGFIPYPYAIRVLRQGAIVIEAPQPRYSDRIYLDVNLEKQVITLFDHGQIVDMYYIAAAGNPRYSPTPKGEFSVLGKEQNHLSSISHVWMPWSLWVVGDYFIHGIPYYPGGKPVTSKYSGGCVRVPTDNQAQLYEKIAIGTPVVIY